MIWSALTYITKLPRLDVPVVVRVVRVSGTIKKAEEEVIRRAKDIIMRAKIAGNSFDSGTGCSVDDIVKAVVAASDAAKRKEEEVMGNAGDSEEDDDSD